MIPASCWATGELTLSFPSEKQPSVPAPALMFERPSVTDEVLFFLLLLVTGESLLQTVLTKADLSLGGKPLFVSTLAEWLLQLLLPQTHCANGPSGSLWHLILSPNLLFVLFLSSSRCRADLGFRP